MLGGDPGPSGESREASQSLTDLDGLKRTDIPVKLGASIEDDIGDYYESWTEDADRRVLQELGYSVIPDFCDPGTWSWNKNLFDDVDDAGNPIGY